MTRVEADINYVHLAEDNELTINYEWLDIKASKEGESRFGYLVISHEKKGIKIKVLDCDINGGLISTRKKVPVKIVKGLAAVAQP